MRQHSMFRSALLLTCVNLLLRLVSTSFQVYLSGRIGAAGIGLLQLVLSVGAMAMTAGIAGVRTATMYLTAEELGKKRPENVIWVLSGCILYSILFSLTVSGCLYYFAPVIADKWLGDLRSVPALRLYAAFLPISCLCGVMSGYFTAANRIGTLAAVEIAEQIVSLGVTMTALIFWAGHDPGKACCAVVLGSGAGIMLTLFCLILLRLRERAPTGKQIPVGHRLLQVALPLALADDLKAGISTTENVMVPKRLGLYRGTEDPLADFGMVCGMVFPILMFPAAILFGLNELLIPELARCNASGSRRRIVYLVKRSLKVALLYGCIFCGLEFLLAQSLCLRLYNNGDAGKYLQLYALLIPMLYCDAVTDAMTKGLGQQKVCVRYNIFTSAMDVILLFLLLPRYGMMGYFFSFLVTHLINFILSLRRLLKITQLRLTMLTPLLAAISTVLALWAASHLSTNIGKGSAFILILGCLLFLCKVLQKEDLFWIKGLVTKK